MTITYRGYLASPYLNGPYLGGYVDVGLGSQVDINLRGNHYLRSQINQKIYDSLTIGSEISLKINDLNNVGSQTDIKLQGTKYLRSQIEQKIIDSMAIGSQASLKIYAFEYMGGQVDLQLISPADDMYLGSEAELVVYELETIGSQSTRKIYKAKILGSQIVLKIADEKSFLSSQVAQKINDDNAPGESAKIGKLLHTVWERYLTNPYLTDGYLAAGFHTWQGSQIEQKLYHPSMLGSQIFKNVYTIVPSGTQILQKIYGDTSIGSQTLRKIYTYESLGSQINQAIYNVLTLPSQIALKIYDDNKIGSQVAIIKIQKAGNQVTLVIYNITQLRILQTFASRGTVALGGNNWTSNVPLKAGDFGTSNLNTDVLEQRCQTNTLPASWILSCDTGLPQGSFIDTLAILEHNLTRSAAVVLQGSSDAGFGTIGFQVVLSSELINTYYISPELPTSGYRYWRLVIDDLTNSNPYLYIGSIVFGSSQIMSVAENFDNPVTFGYRHYKDSVDTEGFTAVSNDRAMRKHLSLTFNDIRYDAGNFRMLKDYFFANKTDLKCLIIPRPTKASAFAVFSKLSSLPDETHNAISDTDHYVAFALDWDESL